MIDRSSFLSLIPDAPGCPGISPPSHEVEEVEEVGGHHLATLLPAGRTRSKRGFQL
jgi:hypothetical protein